MKHLRALLILALVWGGGAGAARLSAATPGGWDKVDPARPKQVLYFTKSSGFEHSVVKRPAPDQLSHSEKVLTELGEKHRFKVTCTKDGRIFTPENLARFDVIVFYTSGDLLEAGTDKQPPMTVEGKEAFLRAIREGKGFVGIHAATDNWHPQPDPPDKSTRFQSVGDRLDPYLRMIGGEFIRHGPQQVARNRVVSPRFPGCEGLGEGFSLNEEWYTFKDFAPDLHVILVQETRGMKGIDYQRPDFPATWARKEGRGRVFYTSLGHREDVWTNPLFQNLLLGGLGWAAGLVEAEIAPNLEQVTPGHRQLQPKDDPNAKKAAAPAPAANPK
ncbi:MAG: ThuA domain-containing protein [Verrucomicrobiae bacterium]|nr:ThuA domain-containing protein [Verrucomicrobiae bacterium]